MKKTFRLGLLAALTFSPLLPADFLVSGTLSMTLLEGQANSLSVFNAYFDETRSRAQVLADAAPGNAAFDDSLSGSISLVDTIRPHAVVPAGYPGTPGASRSPQITNLDLDPTDLFGTWAPSTDQFGVFVLNDGEQIAFTHMQRWTGPFTGSLVYGDFGLRYVPARAVGTVSGLVLTSNIDFLNASWADLANVTYAYDSGTRTMSLSGDLLLSGGLTALDPGATLGTPIGTFTLEAQVIPEPSTVLLVAGALLGLALSRKRLPWQAARRG